MCETSLWVPNNKLRQFQELVKAHDLRFVGNPFFMKERARVTVSSDHLPPGQGNAFWSDWNRMTSDIKEHVRKPGLRTIIRRTIPFLARFGV